MPLCLCLCLCLSLLALSGHVTREEMMEFGRFMNSKFDEDKLNKLMDQMDLDKDGFISMEEFLGYFAKVLAVGYCTPFPPFFFFCRWCMLIGMLACALASRLKGLAFCIVFYFVLLNSNAVRFFLCFVFDPTSALEAH